MPPGLIKYRDQEPPHTCLTTSTLTGKTQSHMLSAYTPLEYSAPAIRRHIAPEGPALPYLCSARAFRWSSYFRFYTYAQPTYRQHGWDGSRTMSPSGFKGPG